MSESFENVFEIDVAEMLELLQITIIRMILGQFLGCRIRDLWRFWMAFEIDPKLKPNNCRKVFFSSSNYLPEAF